MIEKIKHISNPLTVVGIFAAIVEVSGSIILPFLEKENQNIYVWFLILFPTLLLLLFFITLNFNNRVLYSPSDYKSDDSFLKALKIYTQFTTLSHKSISKNILGNAKFITSKDLIKLPDYGVTPTLQSIFLNSEELALRYFEQKIRISIKRQVRIGTDKIYFSGISIENDKLFIFQVVYIFSQEFSAANIEQYIYFISEYIKQIKNQKLTFHLIIVLDKHVEDNNVVKNRINDIIKSDKEIEEFEQALNITEFHILSLSQLENYFNINE